MCPDAAVNVSSMTWALVWTSARCLYASAVKTVLRQGFMYTILLIAKQMQSKLNIENGGF